MYNKNNNRVQFLRKKDFIQIFKYKLKLSVEIIHISNNSEIVLEVNVD